MSDDLLAYYNRELAYFRKLAGEFADAHPKIAGRLRITGETVEDPHVSRLIESFAYLNARTRRKIEDDFPELSEAILNILYPHYLAPFPSCAIVQFNLHHEQAELQEGYRLDRGTELETELIRGEPCRFRTTTPVDLFPFQLNEAFFRGHPFAAPLIPASRDAKSIVQLHLRHYDPAMNFSDLSIGKLRFFLNGSMQSNYDLYELLMNDVISIAVAASPHDDQAVVLPSDAIRPVGFERDEGLLDYSARSATGYRLLTEFFAFPEKFLFFDIEGITQQVLQTTGNGRDLFIFIYMKRHSADVENNVTTNSFRLGCTPVVNIFNQRAEPISLDTTSYRYRIVPDARRPTANEIYSINNVVATSPRNEQVQFLPFYSTNHRGANDACYWYSSREHTQSPTDKGTEVFLNLVNLNYEQSIQSDWTLDIETTCINRDLPGRLPVNVKLHLNAGAEMASAKCLIPPTQTFRPDLGRGTVWRLISHLSLNHLSLTDGHDGGLALREILKLYDLVNSQATRKIIEGLTSVSSRRVVGRVGGPVSGGFCRGTRIDLEFDEEKLTGSGVYLFASVLERFLGLFTSINSFTKTCVSTSSRPDIICEWPPRTGERSLI